MDVNLLFSMTRDLGALQATQRDMMALMERNRVEMHQRCDRLEERLWRIERPPTTSPPGGSGRTIERLTALLQQAVLLAKLTLPLAFLAAVVAYKGANPEWLPLLRRLLAAL